GVLQEPHAIDRSREEFELIGAADVPGPSAIDHAVPIEEHGRTVHGLRPVRQAVSFNTERAPRVRGLKEEIDEPPLREWVPGQRERFVDREPSGVFDLVGFEAELLRSQMALVDEPERVRGLPRETGDVDVQEAVEDDPDADLLPRLSLDCGLAALPVVHEAAG